jgi:DNA-binding response OmpR family regulator
VLEAAGFSVTQSATIAEALTLVRTLRPVVVVLDFMRRARRHVAERIE